MASGTINMMVSTLESLYVGSSDGSGRYYKFKVTWMAQNRFSFLIVTANQSHVGQLIVATVYNSGGSNQILFSDASVTYDSQTNIMTIDEGPSAWAYPMVIYNPNWIAFVDA